MTCLVGASAFSTIAFAHSAHAGNGVLDTDDSISNVGTTVTSSLGLCGIPDPGRLFAEIRRVLRPGGQLLAMEHIRPPNPMLGLLADMADPFHHHFVGCHLNRRTPDLLRKAGYTVEILDRRFLNSGVALVAVP